MPSTSVPEHSFADCVYLSEDFEAEREPVEQDRFVVRVQVGSGSRVQRRTATRNGEPVGKLLTRNIVFDGESSPQQEQVIPQSESGPWA